MAGGCFLVAGTGRALAGGGDAGASTLCSGAGGVKMGTLGSGVARGGGIAGAGRAVARFKIWASGV